MILKNNEPFKVPDKGELSWEALAKVFPGFFDKKKPEPVGIRFVDALKVTGYDEKGKFMEIWPQAKQASQQASILQDGVTAVFRYAAGVKQSGDAYVPQDRVHRISRQFVFLPEMHREFLWFMWFCSAECQNNHNLNANAFKKFVFLFPEKDAKINTEHKLLAGKVNGLILDPDQFSADDVRHLARVVTDSAVEEDTSDLLLRDQISDRVVKDHLFAKDVHRAIAEKDTRLTMIRAMIPELEKAKVIGEYQKKWVFKHELEPDDYKEICTMSPSIDREVRLAQVLGYDDKWFNLLLEFYEK